MLKIASALDAARCCSFGLFTVFLASTIHAQSPHPLITRQVSAEMTTLSGHVLPGISHANDLGTVDDSLPLRLYLVLRRSPEQQADLDNLISLQQQPTAAEYHHWLTPQQFGLRFGAAQQDIAKITSWLQSQGLHVNGVLNNASFIDFSATVGQVRQVFHTQLHTINANGATYPALLQDPMIPAALAPAIAAIHGLNQIPPRTSLVNPHQASYSLAAHRWQDAETFTGALPAADIGGGYYDLTPRDFYAIYNVNKVLNPAPAGLNDLGAGQTIAVLEASDFPYGTVDPVTAVASGGDVANFRSLFGVTGALNMHVYHGYGTQSCGDPGIITNGNFDLEAALDAEWANALAPSANLVVVSCGSLTTALTAAIDYNLADILSLSFNFGGDENATQSTYTFFDGFWSQAAAQGQTVFVSSGDAGSDDADQNANHAATYGLNVNIASASPLVTSAGGTDFSDSYDAQRGGLPQSTYWNGTNSSFYESALGYLPETAWNSSCAGSLLAALFGYQGADYCAKNGAGSFEGGSGGFSSHYPVPAYQAGILGYSGTFRALPDISGFASLTTWGHALLFCDSDYSYWSCSSSSTIGAGGGTSFVSPYLAGVTALLNAYTGSRQGVLNPTLYALAKAQFSSPATSSACYSNGQTSNTGITAGLPASQCIFNDVTTGNNDVPCAVGALNCYTDPGASFGILSLTNAASLTVAYPSTPGYDEATGIGSVNVYNLLTKWNTAFSSSVALTANPATILSSASTSLTAVVTTGVPTGYVDTPPTLTGSVTFSTASGSLGNCVLSSGTCSLTVSGSALQPGANSISATFQGSGTYPASTSSVQTVTVNGGSTQTITFLPLPNVYVGAAPFTLGATASSGLPVSYSSSTTSVCTVAASTLTILAAGTCTITASQAGNATFSAAAPVTRSFTILAPPQVGYVAYWGVNNTGITVSWSTDLPATTQLAYGTTTALGQTSPLQTTLSQSHGVVLTTLTPGTTYYFVAQSTGANGATGSSPVYSFTTTGTATTPAPVITSVTATGITNATATITWTTDQASTSLVNYGTTISYGSSSTPNTSLVTSHSVTLTGLTAGATYDFDVVSANASSVSGTSANFTFTTTGTATPPVISNVATSGISSYSVTITWTTDQATTSLVNYGSTTSYGSSSTFDTSLVTSHSVTLTGLFAATSYDFDVVSANAAGTSATSANFSFTTASSSGIPPKVGYVAYWGVNNMGVTISWSTDILASTQLAYGTTTALGQLSPLQTTLSASHGVVLTNLNPGTTYYFVAQSTGANGATGYSTAYSFTTTGTATNPAPIISSVTATGIANTSATINWTTDQASSSQVNYGTTTSYGSSTTNNPTLVTSHSVTLAGLTAGTTYNFDVVSANASSLSSTSSNSTFTTTGAGTPPPVISNVATSAITSSSVTVTWTTDQATSSLVNYGSTTAYGASSTLNTNLVTSHSVTLTGLAAGTTYDFDVVSANSTSIPATSANSTFTTAASTGTPPYVGYVAYWGVNNTGVTISWSTDVPATTQLAYGPTTVLGQLSPLQTTLSQSHGVVLTGLNPGTTYYFVAHSTAANGATGYSTTYSFTTTGMATSPAPVISSVAAGGISSTSATLTWTTDQASSSQVNYGTTTSYGSSSTLNPALVTSHSITLSGLTAGTMYNFDVVSANASSVSSTSTNSTFTTTGTVSAPVISSVTTGGITSTSVIITWTTDQATSSLVNYGITGAYGSSSTLNTTLVTSHSVTLTGLTPGTTYNFDVASSNAANTSATSANYTFTTAAAGGTPPNISYVAFYGISNSGVTISWSTDVAATTQVAYGTTTTLGQFSPLQSALVASHGVTLAGLNPGTTYYFVAQSTTASSVTGYSSQYSFTTTGSTAPVISAVIVAPSTGNTASITWTTSTPTNSYVQFGTAAGSYTMYSAPTNLTTNPQCKLPFVPSGVIHYQLVSTDAYGTQTISADATFTEP